MTKHLKSIILILLTVVNIQAAVYEDLEYGDSKQTVTDKLMKCPRVTNSVPRTMFGRVGLNGTFKINKQLENLPFSLFFGWDSSEKLNEVTLRSSSVPAGQYDSTLKEVFLAASSLLTDVYGNPVVSNAMPSSHKITAGMILSSQLWNVGSGSVTLGIAKQDNKFYISIGFTKKRIDPVSN